MQHIELYKDEANEWRWTLFAANGNKLADSGEGYKNRADCLEQAAKQHPGVEVRERCQQLFAQDVVFRPRHQTTRMTSMIEQVFWDWAQWQDRLKKNPRLPMPHTVVRFYRMHAIKKAPLKWRARYAIHRGYKPPKPPTHAPVPESPGLPVGGGKYLCPIFCAENPEGMLGYGIHGRYTFWLSADPAYRHCYTHDVVERIKHEDHKIGVWYNPVQVSGDIAKAFARELGVPGDMIMGQFETSPEFAQSVADGCKVMVGNLSALNQDQIGMIRRQEVVALVEDYWNVQPWLKLDFMNLPIPCTVKGIYNGQGDSPTYGRYLNVNDYRAAGRWSRYDGVYSSNGPASGGRPEDAKQLRE